MIGSRLEYHRAAVCRCRDKDVSIAKINSTNLKKKFVFSTGQDERNGVSFFWEFHHEFDVHGLAC